MKPVEADKALFRMAGTFQERNSQYGNNYIQEGYILAALFPDGVTISTARDHVAMDLLRSVMVKLTRFVNSGLTHQDSIHDAGVYCAMLEDFIVKNPLSEDEGEPSK